MRAIAVVLVLLFHFHIPGFDSGFLGVDVFFVLSGFLITGLLLAEAEKSGRISLAGFWARRARRLLPALLILILVVAVVTWVTAAFIERRALRGDLLATTAYVANWHLISTSSYFSNPGFSSPMEHMWSLAIEEQFYLLWPMVVALLVAFTSRRWAIGIVAGLGIAASAFLLSHFWSPEGVERAYMGTDSRVFEPLVGALGAVLVVSPRSRRFCVRYGDLFAALGLVGFLVCLIVIAPKSRNYYQGWGLILSLSTLLILAPLWLGRAQRLGAALSWRPVAWIGLISYGIYLWHWPIAVWLGVDGSSGDHLAVRRVVAVVLTIGIAAASYYVVERPIRHGLWLRAGPERSGRSAVLRRRTLIAVPIALVASACVSVTLTRVPPISPGDRVLMLVGDSVAEQLEVPIETALSDLGWRLAPAAHGGCPVTGEEAITSDGRPLPFAVRCATAAVPTMQDQAIEQDHPDVVVWWDRVSVASFIGPDGEKLVSGSKDWWLARTSALKGAVARFHTTGAVVVFVATEPPGSAIMAARYFGCDGPGCVWRRFQVEHYADVTARWNALMRSYAEQHPGWLAYVNISDVVCHDDAVPCNDAVDGQPARNDGVHYVGDACAVVVGGLLDHLAPILARFH